MGGGELVGAMTPASRPPGPRRLPPGLDWLWLLVCVLASSGWCLTAAAQLSATWDEPVYLRVGLERWRSGSYWSLLRLGTMPLPVDVQTLPLYVAERLRGLPFDPVADFDVILPWARAATLLFWWLLLLYGWLAGWQLGGRWAGRLAVGLLASEPTLLAHASLATTDVAVAACVLALVYHFRRGREASWRWRVGLPALWYAAAVLTKASGLVLGLSCLAVSEAERLVRAGILRPAAGPGGSPLGRAWAGLRPFRRDVAQIVGLGLLVVFVYCGSDWRAEPTFVAWSRGLPEGPSRNTMIWVADHLRIFRNAGDGLVRQVKHNLRGRETFLLGRVYPRGVWYYFPTALTIKLTLTWLALPVLIALWRPRALANWACVLAATLILLSVTFRVQLGIRFLLPLYAIAAVGLAAAAVQAIRESPPGWPRRMLVAAVGAGLAWTAVSAARVWPNGLSYTNELWGGTANGYRRLGDSNYDWGQGLKELARWQAAHGIAALDVWYFGTDPSVGRPPMARASFADGIAGPADVLDRVRGRYLAASTTLLYGKLPTDSERRTAAFLRGRQPIGRTTTFFVYDFTKEPAPGS